MQALAFRTPTVEHFTRNGRASGRSTPWGKADLVRTFARGIVEVGTEGHGGIGISLGVATSACLSFAARRKAELKCNTFWFEEDCRWAIAAWELGPTFWAIYFADDAYGFEPDNLGGSALLDAEGYGENRTRNRISVRQYLARVISGWDADYFIETEQTPFLTTPEYERWQGMQEDTRLRAEKSPDLITSASKMSVEKIGDRYGEGVQVVRVHTADGKWHDVTPESYSARTTPNLLSRCEVLATDIGEDFY